MQLHTPFVGARRTIRERIGGLILTLACCSRITIPKKKLKNNIKKKSINPQSEGPWSATTARSPEAEQTDNVVSEETEP
jgi:hypothetical protein